MYQKISVYLFLSCFVLSSYAAERVDLSHQNISILQSFLPATKPSLNATTVTDLKEINRQIDFNRTEHVRLKQMYKGYPVWGGDALVHIPETKQSKNIRLISRHGGKETMNGTLYKNLSGDLQEAPSTIFNPEQAAKALAYALSIDKKPKSEIKNPRSELMVYVDKDNKAHWVFKVSFYLPATNRLPAKPVYLLDAITFEVYKTWNEVKSLQTVKGGGYGGNLKMGKLVYDGLAGHLPALTISRHEQKKHCYLVNQDVSVTDFRTGQLAHFPCTVVDARHGEIYWDELGDGLNGAYSPSNDALYAGNIIKNMYQEWFGLPVLEEDGKPLVLAMVTHSPNYNEDGYPDPDNAQWDPEQKKMYFGDGKSYFYPLTSLGIAAHEISHGFTEQHSKLEYEGESGGLNESFSDMAAQAAEYYAYDRKNSWEIAPEVTKENNKALRYMKTPTKDCYGGKPGFNCSVDNAQDFYRHKDMNVHLSSGIFNRAFYLLASAPDWDVEKAFRVMVKANMHYWTPTTTFLEAACGVMSAANDYHYDTSAITRAFAQVGLDTGKC